MRLPILLVFLLAGCGNKVQKDLDAYCSIFTESRGQVEDWQLDRHVYDEWKGGRHKSSVNWMETLAHAPPEQRDPMTLAVAEMYDAAWSCPAVSAWWNEQAAHSELAQDMALFCETARSSSTWDEAVTTWTKTRPGPDAVVLVDNASDVAPAARCETLAKATAAADLHLDCPQLDNLCAE